MTTAEVLTSCPLVQWKGEKGRCQWCDEPLVGRRRAWCSDECSWEFTRNHMWPSARNAALKRDGRKCVRCPGDPGVMFTWARGSGKPFAWRYSRLEVHHVEQILGRHGEFGCHHHVDGLVTLCLFHHVEEHHGAVTEQLSLDP